jgi:hypothetical protein
LVRTVEQQNLYAAYGVRTAEERGSACMCVMACGLSQCSVLCALGCSLAHQNAGQVFSLTILLL